jgi:p-cumate 2,3-dioxygenase beta subunit
MTRSEIEDFLYAELELLDAWKLDEWLALFAPEGRYVVPPLDRRDAGDDSGLFVINDDRERLASRVRQYLGPSAWAEIPHSRTRHTVANVRVRADDGVLLVRANFVVYRFRHELVDTYVGEYHHRLVPANGGLLFHERRAVLDLEALRPQGKLSIIV